MNYTRTMNKLDDTKRAMMVRALCEGNSLRAVARMGGMSFNTVVKLLVDLGEACEWYQDKHLVNLSCTEVQMDEIWSFVGCKEKNKEEAINDHPGDVWTWTALCPNTKLIVGWLVGDRDADAANEFCCDVGKRFSGHIQVTTDGHAPYRFAVGLGFKDGAPESHHADEYAPIHTPNERSFQEDREPLPRRCLAFHALQLLPQAHHTQDHSSRCRWRSASPVEH